MYCSEVSKTEGEREESQDNSPQECRLVTGRKKYSHIGRGCRQGHWDGGREQGNKGSLRTVGSDHGSVFLGTPVGSKRSKDYAEMKGCCTKGEKVKKWWTRQAVLVGKGRNQTMLTEKNVTNENRANEGKTSREGNIIDSIGASDRCRPLFLLGLRVMLHVEHSPEKLHAKL